MDQEDLFRIKLSIREKFLIGTTVVVTVLVTRSCYNKTHIKTSTVNNHLVQMFLDGTLKAGDGSDKILQYA